MNLRTYIFPCSISEHACAHTYIHTYMYIYTRVYLCGVFGYVRVCESVIEYVDKCESVIEFVCAKVYSNMLTRESVCHQPFQPFTPVAGTCVCRTHVIQLSKANIFH